MKRYDERMLNKLLDRYESSLLYREKNRINITIFVPIQKSTFPEYFDEGSMQYDVIHEQMEALEEKGLVRLVWKNKKKGHILQKCELSVERAPEAYAYLRRKPMAEKEQDILKVCDLYRGKAEGLDRFLTWVEMRIDSGGSVRKYINPDSPGEFSLLCELIWRILKNEKECFLRQFSIRYFHDSKLAEKDIEKAAAVIVRFSDAGMLNGLDTAEVLEEYNIYRNPSWLMMKGYGCLRMGEAGSEAEIDLRALKSGIGIANKDIDSIRWSMKICPDRILTIENMTSFHQWDPKSDVGETVLSIYLGGYHNQIKRVFLKRLYQAYPQAEYYHFGDIDCGGFRIWKDLCQKTGIRFRTLWMDCDTYRKYLHLGRELKDIDRKTLRQMMEDPFFQEQKELFAMMLAKGVKLEQECVTPF